jgi:hypothetical protein
MGQQLPLSHGSQTRHTSPLQKQDLRLYRNTACNPKSPTQYNSTDFIDIHRFKLKRTMVVLHQTDIGNYNLKQLSCNSIFMFFLQVTVWTNMLVQLATKV